MALEAMTYEVTARWDSEAGVWVAESEDVPGLVAEAPTPNELMAKLQVLVPEPLELNGPLPDQAFLARVLKLTCA